MRWMMFVFAIGCTIGCTSTPADTLSDLSQRAVQCGNVDDTCAPGKDAATIIACMNAALANGTLAETSWSDYTDEMNVWEYDVFADDGRVRVFFTDPIALTEMSTVTEQASCAGPFAASDLTVCLDIAVVGASGCDFTPRW